MNRTHRAQVTACLLLFAHAATISAARADDSETAKLLLRGFELRREHRNEEALVAYQDAFALSPTPAVRAQRALAEQALGRWILAEQDLDLALASDDSWVTRNRAALEEAKEVVSKHLAWLTVDVDVSDAEIHLDGEVLEPGKQKRVVAGAALLEVRAAGRIPDVRRVSFAPAEQVHQQIALVPLMTAAAIAPGASSTEHEPAVMQAAPSDSAKPRTGVPVIPIVLGAVGIAGLGVGTYFGIRTGDHKSDERAHCVGGCTQAAAGDYNDAQTSATASTIAFAAGLTLIAGGAVLWLLDRSEPRPGPSHVSIAPAFGPGMNGLVLGGAL